ncbi:butyrophilin subfamily 1 member A1-like [Polymixia lowei]
MRDPPIRLSLKEKPQTVGVFVDYEEGLVSFYDVKDKPTELNLVVPSDPVIGSVGHDIILPCHLSPQTSAVAMGIRWFKKGNFLDYMYLYEAGKSSEGKGYEGRVSLFSQELERGNVSLLLKDVRMSDGGLYTCQANLREWVQEQIVDLQTTQYGSDPMISLVKHQRDSIEFSCRSQSWSPEPHMIWTDRSRQEVTSATTEKPQKMEGSILYSIESHVSIGNGQMEEVVCVVMSQDRKYELKSAIKITEEFYDPRVFDRMYVSAFVIPIFLAMVAITASVLYAQQQRKEDVTLDPDTAYPRLTVSEDKKSVSFGELNKALSITEIRFLDGQCVLGTVGYEKGRHYWEVDLGKKTQWTVGVAEDPSNRGGKIQTYPKNGYWSINLEDGHLKTMEETPTVLPNELKPRKLGVFLDYERGTIAFFNVEKRCHIHSFYGKFTRKLYPFIGPLLKCKEELKVSPVEIETFCTMEKETMQ